LARVPTGRVARWRTGLAEFDFVLGGGTVPGSLVLVGGEPGIGKSTLLLQCATRLEAAGKLGELQVINGSEILLGDPFIFTKENVGEFDF
jgi:predicted ATP-dependent serine protease